MQHQNPDLDFDDTRIILHGASCTIAAQPGAAHACTPYNASAVHARKRPALVPIAEKFFSHQDRQKMALLAMIFVNNIFRNRIYRFCKCSNRMGIFILRNTRFETFFIGVRSKMLEGKPDDAVSNRRFNTL
jgi:hypothetical protein